MQSRKKLKSAKAKCKAPMLCMCKRCLATTKQLALLDNKLTAMLRKATPDKWFIDIPLSGSSGGSAQVLEILTSLLITDPKQGFFQGGYIGNSVYIHSIDLRLQMGWAPSPFAISSTAKICRFALLEPRSLTDFATQITMYPASPLTPFRPTVYTKLWADETMQVGDSFQVADPTTACGDVEPAYRFIQKVYHINRKYVWDTLVIDSTAEDNNYNGIVLYMDWNVGLNQTYYNVNARIYYNSCS